MIYVLLDHSSIFEQYAIAFYWAVVSTTQVGYGDIVANNHTEVGGQFVHIEVLINLLFLLMHIQRLHHMVVFINAHRNCLQVW